MTFKLGLGCFTAAVVFWWIGGVLPGAHALAGMLLVLAYAFIEHSVKVHERAKRLKAQLEHDIGRY